MIFHPDHQDIYCLQIVRDVKRKVLIASDMLSDPLTIQVDCGDLVHCTEMEQHPVLLKPLRQDKTPPVKEICILCKGLVDT